jgi:hypothetical protein
MKSSTARRYLFIAACAVGALLTTAAARASDVQWSIGISAPIFPGAVSTVISNAPVHAYGAPHPVYVHPAPVYYAPAPVYYYPPRPVHYAPPVIYRPAPVFVTGWAPGHRGHWQQQDDRGGRWRDRHDRRER